MSAKYLYKCNPLVAKAAGVTSFNRYSWNDGTIMLWEDDMVAIDRVRFKLDRDNFLADLGAVKMTDPEAAAEQKNPTIRLQMARLPQFRWEQPGDPFKSDSAEDEAQELAIIESEEIGSLADLLSPEDKHTEDGNNTEEGGEG